eukprot:scaffold112202_cov19-Prasinocladus_malaysianus.AAC.1
MGLPQGTSYITPHGNTPTIDLARGTLQGDTLSPLLFLFFLEPLLRWLQVGSRGYKPRCLARNTSSANIQAFPGHAFADDISLITDTIQNIQ